MATTLQVSPPYRIRENFGLNFAKDFLTHLTFFTRQSISPRVDLKTSRLIFAVCSLFALTIASAQTPPSDGTLTANPVFQKNCAKCHGKTAEGRHFGGPSLISDKVTAASVDDLRAIITNGKGHMPKYTGKLAPEEIGTLVKQIEALNKK
jgi:mono/diheme cytochrome c family protein